MNIVNQQILVRNPHRIRSRKSGNMKFIDMHLELNKDLTLEEAHKICDSIEIEVENKMRNTEILIHAEPWGSPIKDSIRMTN